MRVKAGQTRRTVGVHTALGLDVVVGNGDRFALLARDVRIADRRGKRTRTLRLMTDASAFGPIAARVFIADGSADAIQSIARMIVGTVFVVLAHARNAGDQRIALRASRTRARRTMQLHVAFGQLAARDRRIIRARIEALLVQACLVVRTLVVRCALGPVALAFGVSAPAGWTGAMGPMAGGVTLGMCRARIAIGARIAAALIQAGQLGGAIAV